MITCPVLDLSNFQIRDLLNEVEEESSEAGTPTLWQVYNHCQSPSLKKKSVAIYLSKCFLGKGDSSDIWRTVGFRFQVGIDTWAPTVYRGPPIREAHMKAWEYMELSPGSGSQWAQCGHRPSSVISLSLSVLSEWTYLVVWRTSSLVSKLVGETYCSGEGQIAASEISPFPYIREKKKSNEKTMSHPGSERRLMPFLKDKGMVCPHHISI